MEGGGADGGKVYRKAKGERRKAGGGRRQIINGLTENWLKDTEHISITSDCCLGKKTQRNWATGKTTRTFKGGVFLCMDCSLW